MRSILLFYIYSINICDTIVSIISIRTIIYIESILHPYSIEDGMKISDENKTDKTSIQISSATRDRLYRLKFRRTYDQFLDELCEMYEKMRSEEGKTSPQNPP